jgi:hypothetical protein
MRTPKLPSFATVLGIIFMIIAFLMVYAMILFMLDPNSFVFKADKALISLVIGAIALLLR